MSRFASAICLAVAVASAVIMGRPEGAAAGALAPMTTYSATRLPTTAVKPVVVDIAPVVTDLSAVTQDLDGAATVGQSSQKVDVVLNANVLFGKDSDVLQPAANARLQEVATVIGSYAQGGRLAIDGYTDDLGSAEHGLNLSRRRAAAVEKVLRPLLPATVVITVTGHGEASPAYPNDSEENRAKNRRVELHFVAG